MSLEKEMISWIGTLEKRVVNLEVTVEDLLKQQSALIALLKAREPKKASWDRISPKHLKKP